VAAAPAAVTAAGALPAVRNAGSELNIEGESMSKKIGGEKRRNTRSCGMCIFICIEIRVRRNVENDEMKRRREGTKNSEE